MLVCDCGDVGALRSQQPVVWSCRAHHRVFCTAVLFVEHLPLTPANTGLEMLGVPLSLQKALMFKLTLKQLLSHHMLIISN